MERRWGSCAALRDGAKPGACDSDFSFTKERRGLVIGSGILPELSVPGN